MRVRRCAKSSPIAFSNSLKPPATGRVEIVDADAPGLVMRVTAKGAKSWAIRYRPKGGGQQRASYGAYPAVKLADARQRARDIAAAAAKGSICRRPRNASATNSEGATAGRKRSAICSMNTSSATASPISARWNLTDRMFEAHVKPVIGKVPLGDLRRGDIVELLDDLQNEKGFGAQVNRVRSQILAALNWAVEREYKDVNPAAAVKKRKIEASRDRVLNDDELRAIWRAADRLPRPEPVIGQGVDIDRAAARRSALHGVERG